jgi:hypothetical protein
MKRASRAWQKPVEDPYTWCALESLLFAVTRNILDHDQISAFPAMVIFQPLLHHFFFSICNSVPDHVALLSRKMRAASRACEDSILAASLVCPSFGSQCTDFLNACQCRSLALLAQK